MTEEKVQEERLVHEEGKFDSPFDGYPGYIQFPYPLMGSQYKRWLKVSHKDIQEGGQKKDFDVEDLPVFSQWRAALSIVEFHLENLDAADITPGADNVPTMVQSWVTEATAEYLANQLNLKN